MLINQFRYLQNLRGITALSVKIFMRYTPLALGAGIFNNPPPLISCLEIIWPARLLIVTFALVISVK